MENLWIYGAFLQVLNMSITAGIVICGVLLVRILLKKAPKIFSYLLWGVVLFRLLCPLAPVTSVSAFRPWNASVDEAGRMEFVRTIRSAGDVGFHPAASGDAKQPEADLPKEESQRASLQTDAFDWKEFAAQTGSVLWLSGAFVVAGFGVVRYLRLKKKLNGAHRIKDNLYLSDCIDTPFTIGVISPRIYLPFFLSEQEEAFVILHEQTHIRRKDPFLKLLAFFALALHWFNPLVWIAFYEAEKDMEMACDEAVIKKMKEDVRAEYSKTLLCLAAGKRIAPRIPIAFGESDTKSRVRNIMRCKRPAVAMAGAAFVLVLCCVALLGTNPGQKTGSGVKAFASDTEAFSEKDEKLAEFVNGWARAFCARDADAIVSMSAKEAQKALREAQLLDESKEGRTFGHESPWPINPETDYRIAGMTENGAQILYYAWTKEPHVVVWRETLEFVQKEEGWLVQSEQLEILDHIGSGEAYQRAYPFGISDTPMDYRKGDMAKELQTYAKLSSTWINSILSDPEQAALYLLNIAEHGADTDAVIQKSGAAVVKLRFSDGYETMVGMVRTDFAGEGEDQSGIWILGDYEEDLQGNKPENNMLYAGDLFAGQYVEAGGYYDKEQGERVLYSTEADITHDGIPDRIELVLGTEDMETPAVELIEGITNAYLKAYRGIGEGAFEEEAFYVSGEVGSSHAANGQIGLLKKDGLDYLLVSSMYSIAGQSEYSYAVFYLDTDLKAAVCAEQDFITFVSDSQETSGNTQPDPKDVLPDFRDKLDHWLSDGILLVSCDVFDAPEVCISGQNGEYPAQDYYNRVWKRFLK